MNKRSLTLIALSCAVAFPTVFATDNSPASETSIKQLLEVTQAHKLHDAILAHIDEYMKQAMKQATQAGRVTPDIQKEIDTFQAEMTSAAREALDWNRLQAIQIRIYQKSLTQDDVDGLISFYKTPAGQALVTKMPAVMQNTMNEMQEIMKPMLQRIQQKQQQIVAQVEAEKKKSGG
jgi:hypothetical protein